MSLCDAQDVPQHGFCATQLHKGLAMQALGRVARKRWVQRVVQDSVMHGCFVCQGPPFLPRPADLAAGANAADGVTPSAAIAAPLASGNAGTAAPPAAALALLVRARPPVRAFGSGCGSAGGGSRMSRDPPASSAGRSG